MYLPAFSTPTDKVRVSRATIETHVSSADDRTWVIVYNSASSDVEVGLAVDSEGRPIPSFRLLPGESKSLGSPAWHGPVYLVSGPGLIVTEVLRHDSQ